MGQIQLSGMCSRLTREQPGFFFKQNPPRLPCDKLGQDKGLGMVRLDAELGQGSEATLGSVSAVCFGVQLFPSVPVSLSAKQGLE